MNAFHLAIRIPNNEGLRRNSIGQVGLQLAAYLESSMVGFPVYSEDSVLFKDAITAAKPLLARPSPISKVDA